MVPHWIIRSLKTLLVIFLSAILFFVLPLLMVWVFENVLGIEFDSPYLGIKVLLLFGIWLLILLKLAKWSMANPTMKVFEEWIRR